MKRKRKTACVFAAAVMSAALLGGQVTSAWTGYENKVEKSSFFPDNVTVDSPTELGEISLPDSDYGTFSWCDESYVPSKRVETCKVQLKPFRSVDLSGYSGWDEEEGVLIGKVTVVTLSYESDRSEMVTEEQSISDNMEEVTEETTFSGETSFTEETMTSEETTGTEDTTDFVEEANTEETTLSGEMAVTEEVKVSGETQVAVETEISGETQVAVETEVPGETQVAVEAEVSEETVAGEEIKSEETISEEMVFEPSTEETTNNIEETTISEEVFALEPTVIEEASAETTLQTEGEVLSAQETQQPEDADSETQQSAGQGGNTISDASGSQEPTDSDAESNQPELPGGELLVPLVPSVTPAETTGSEESAKPGIIAQETVQEENTQEETTQEEIAATEAVFNENLSVQEQAEQAALNHTCAGITVSGGNLPWYVQFQVSDGTDYQFSNEDGAAVFSAYEFRLWDLKNNTEYEVPDGEYISITIPVKEGYSYTIEHILDNGAVETIVPSVSEGVMVFSTHSFSPFGIAGTKLLVGEEIAEKTYSGSSSKTTPTPTSKATPTPTSKATSTQTSKTTPTPTTKATPTPTSKATPTPTKAAATGTSGKSGSGTGVSSTGASSSGASSTGVSGSGASGTGTSGTGAVKTGDDTPTGFFGLLAAAAAGIAIFTMALKRKEKE